MDTKTLIILLVFLLVHIIWSVCFALLAYKKHHSFFIWLIFSLFVPVAWIYILFFLNDRNSHLLP